MEKTTKISNEKKELSCIQQFIKKIFNKSQV